MYKYFYLIDLVIHSILILFSVVLQDYLPFVRKDWETHQPEMYSKIKLIVFLILLSNYLIIF